jgi:sporulation protein YlmC with PRC-barrel domain
MNLNFSLIGLKVVTQDGKKLGKVVDYTLDSGTFMIYQLIVQRPFMSSLMDPELTINRSQIIEIDDFKVTIKHDKAEVKMPKKKKDEVEEFVPNFTNPFRKPAYTEEESVVDSSSKMSE